MAVLLRKFVEKLWRGVMTTVTFNYDFNYYYPVKIVSHFSVYTNVIIVKKE